MSEEKPHSFLVPALAGAFSGFSTRLVTGPLDTLKIRNQLLWQHGEGSNTSLLYLTRAIIREEGVTALWKGTVPGMCLWMSYSFVQFGVYDYLQHNTYIHQLNTKYPVSLLSGAVAASLATVLTYPFDIIRTQFVIQGQIVPYHSMTAFVRSASAAHGAKVFYQGLSAAILGVAPYMGLNFFLYAHTKRLLTRTSIDSRPGSTTDQSSSLKLLSIEGVAGSVAGGVAKLVFYPLDTMKRRMQASVLQSTLQHSTTAEQLGYSSLRACIEGVWRREGLFSFYRGMVPTILKAAVSSGVGFLSFEMAKRLLIRYESESDTS